MTEPEAIGETTYLSNAPDEIEAQFRDEDAMDMEPLEDSESLSQDFEWVEESEYIILDFGGAGTVGKDMIDHAKAGYSLVVSFPFKPRTLPLLRVKSPHPCT